MNKYRLAEIERYIFEFFAEQRKNKLLTKQVFDDSPQYANADLVRAFEDLEKKWRLLVRYTDEGDDWVQLTREGVEHVGYVGSDEFVILEETKALPHPPKSRPG
jgi:hypothetical protein